MACKYLKFSLLIFLFIFSNILPEVLEYKYEYEHKNAEKNSDLREKEEEKEEKPKQKNSIEINFQFQKISFQIDEKAAISSKTTKEKPEENFKADTSIQKNCIIFKK